MAFFNTADDPSPKGQVEMQTKSKVELGVGGKRMQRNVKEWV